MTSCSYSTPFFEWILQRYNSPPYLPQEAIKWELLQDLRAGATLGVRDCGLYPQ